jgi:hypothetical protein
MLRGFAYMLNIRDEFVRKISDKASYSIGVYAVLLQGLPYQQSLATIAPDAPIVVAAGPPDTPGVRMIKYAPTHSQAYKIVAENSYKIFEAFLAELVQIWFDFLADIYEQAIDDNLKGVQNHPIPKSEIKVDFSLSGSELTQQLKESARKDFDFLPANKKLEIIRKALQKDLSGKEVQLIKTSIKIRNMLQHGNGIVSPEDLKDLGVSAIQEDHGHVIQDVLVSKKVSVTPLVMQKTFEVVDNVEK